MSYRATRSRSSSMLFAALPCDLPGARTPFTVEVSNANVMIAVATRPR